MHQCRPGSCAAPAVRSAITVLRTSALVPHDRPYEMVSTRPGAEHPFMMDERAMAQVCSMSACYCAAQIFTGMVAVVIVPRLGVGAPVESPLYGTRCCRGEWPARLITEPWRPFSGRSFGFSPGSCFRHRIARLAHHHYPRKASFLTSLYSSHVLIHVKHCARCRSDMRTSQR